MNEQEIRANLEGIEIQAKDEQLAALKLGILERWIPRTQGVSDVPMCTLCYVKVNEVALTVTCKDCIVYLATNKRNCTALPFYAGDIRNWEPRETKVRGSLAILETIVKVLEELAE